MRGEKTNKVSKAASPPIFGKSQNCCKKAERNSRKLTLAEPGCRSTRDQVPGTSATRHQIAALLLQEHQEVLVLFLLVLRTYDTDCIKPSTAQKVHLAIQHRLRQGHSKRIQKHGGQFGPISPVHLSGRTNKILLELGFNCSCLSTAQLAIPPLWSRIPVTSLAGAPLDSVGSTPQHHECLDAPRGPRLRTLVCACVRCGYASTVAETDGPLASSHDVKALLRSLRRLLAGTLFPGCVRQPYSDSYL